MRGGTDSDRQVVPTRNTEDEVCGQRLQKNGRHWMKLKNSPSLGISGETSCSSARLILATHTNSTAIYLIVHIVINLNTLVPCGTDGRLLTSQFSSTFKVQW